MIPPTHEKIFRIKLFVATPLDDFRGINSVSIVVAILKMSIEPIPKKKLATSCVERQLTSQMLIRLDVFMIDLLVQPKKRPSAPSTHTR